MSRTPEERKFLKRIEGRRYLTKGPYGACLVQGGERAAQHAAHPADLGLRWVPGKPVGLWVDISAHRSELPLSPAQPPVLTTSHRSAGFHGAQPCRALDRSSEQVQEW